MENTDSWMKRIGISAALEQRILQRRALKLNCPFKPIGLALMVAARTGAFQKHSLFCKCAECIPPEIEPWINKMKKWNLSLTDPRPVTVLPSAAAPKKCKSKWRQRGNSGN